MDSVDIIFPLNLSSLTYYVSEELKGIVRPGQFVRADIKNTERIGLVIGKSSDQGVKPIKGICTNEPIIGEALLKLINWMSEYYMVNKGLVLKTMYSRVFFDVISDGFNVASILNRNKGYYRTQLFHLRTCEDEFSLLVDLINKEKGIIILVPERFYIERISQRLKPLFGKRLCVLHGDLSDKERKQAYLQIITGQSDVVIGTRTAIFAPLSNVSVIVILREEDSSYKNIRGMKFHARDVAVMRGFLEKTRVILSSSAPSLESYYNVRKGKYEMTRYGGKVRGPRIEVIDMKSSRKVSPYISKRAFEIAKGCLETKGNLLFLINRKGYSLIRCSDCDYIEGCKTCKVPLVYHRDKEILICHYCGKRFPINQLCPACGGVTLEAVGAGTQRIEAEIERLLGVKPIRLEKGINTEEVRLHSLKEGVAIVSTGIMKQLFPERFFKACVFINPDIHLQLPDFRSGEHLFQELYNIKNWIVLEGIMLVQTRFSENHVYRAFRKGSIDEFYDIELSMRRSLLYPPFSGFATVSVTSGREGIKLFEEILKSPSFKELIYSSNYKETILSDQRKRCSWLLILKSSSKKRLHEEISKLIAATEGKNDTRLQIDIDPSSINLDY